MQKFVLNNYAKIKSYLHSSLHLCFTTLIQQYRCEQMTTIPCITICIRYSIEYDSEKTGEISFCVFDVLQLLQPSKENYENAFSTICQPRRSSLHSVYLITHASTIGLERHHFLKVSTYTNMVLLDDHLMTRIT